jgi:hypothetical protein
MVLEALAAVSLAGNIFQFIDFACKLFDGATSIYQSHAGATKETQDIEEEAQRLQEVCSILHSIIPTTGKLPHTTQVEAALHHLAQQCEATANDMLSALRRVKATNPNSKGQSFRAGLATIWKEPQITAMQKRLDSHRLQLILHLQLMKR